MRYPSRMLYTFERSLPRVRKQFESMHAIPSQLGEALFVPRPEISGWSVGEHLDHLAKVSGGILHVLLKDEPLEHRAVSALGKILLAAGWIPRGKGRSPERLRGAVGSVSELEALFVQADELLERVTATPPRERKRPLLKHPVFGGLTANEAMRFIAVHNHHHLKIMRDIARASGRAFAMP